MTIIICVAAKHKQTKYNQTLLSNKCKMFKIHKIWFVPGDPLSKEENSGMLRDWIITNTFCPDTEYKYDVCGHQWFTSSLLEGHDTTCDY